MSGRTLDTITNLSKLPNANYAQRVVNRLWDEGYAKSEVWAQGCVIYGRNVIGREISRVLKEIKCDDEQKAEEEAEARWEREEKRQYEKWADGRRCTPCPVPYRDWMDWTLSVS